MRENFYLGLAMAIFCSVIMLIGSGTGFAQGPAWQQAGEDMPEVFMKAKDVNGDGKVDMEEIGRPSAMETFDKNKDGVIELSEAPTYEYIQKVRAEKAVKAANEEPGEEKVSRRGQPH